MVSTNSNPKKHRLLKRSACADWSSQQGWAKRWQIVARVVHFEDGGFADKGSWTEPHRCFALAT